MNQEVFHIHQRVKFVGPPDDGLLGTVQRIERDKLKVLCDDSSKKWNLRSKDHFTAAFIESISSAATLVPPTVPTSGRKTRKLKSETTTTLPIPPSPSFAMGTSIVQGIDRDWNSSKDVYFPPCFTNKSVKEIPKIDHVTGNVTWNGKSYTSVAWLEQLMFWEMSFPNIKDPVTKCTRWEKPGDKHTTDIGNIDYCWNSMDRRTLPTRWKDIFRVDMWGNVVSKLASNNSLTKFDVDHAFPWSRGGRSVEANFVGCHHAANRLEKNDKLFQSLDPVKMNLGIRADQFIALFAYAESRAAPTRRLDQQAERDRVQAWLVRSPRNGKQISNFQLECRTTDGEALYLFLEHHFEPQPQPSMTIPSTTTVVANANTTLPPPIPTSSLLATVTELPTIYLHCSTTDVPGHIRIQAYGPGTFPLKNILKHAPYDMCWAGDKKHPRKSDYWYKTVKTREERDAFSQICYDLCQSNGMQLSVSAAMVR